MFEELKQYLARLRINRLIKRCAKPYDPRYDLPKGMKRVKLMKEWYVMLDPGMINQHATELKTMVESFENQGNKLFDSREGGVNLKLISSSLGNADAAASLMVVGRYCGWWTIKIEPDIHRCNVSVAEPLYKRLEKSGGVPKVLAPA